jgi:transcriptional regulator with XRE-family HTH domain
MANRPRSAERIQVATALRRLREDAGIPRERAAEALNCTATKIGYVETAVSGIKHAELEKLLDLYGIDEARREDLLNVNSQAHRRRPRSKHSAPVAPWLRRILDVEATAVEALYSSFELVPAALQIEPYARALMVAYGRNGAELEKNLELRMGHGDLLTDREPPLRLWAVIAEPALRANIGGPATMCAQLDHIMTMTELEQVTVQVVLQRAGPHALTGTTITLFRLPDGLPSLGSVDTPFGAYFADRPEQVEKIGRWFDHTRAKALGVEESRALVARIRRETKE